VVTFNPKIINRIKIKICPKRHWELDAQGQPTQQIIESRRRADFITPIPKPKKRRKESLQQEMVFDEGKGLSTKDQQYDPTSIINEVRGHVDRWRTLPSSQWQVTPETARLLQHWRHHKFSGFRPFFCQIEAVETAIWLRLKWRDASKTGLRRMTWSPSGLRGLPSVTVSTKCSVTISEIAE